MAMKVSPDSTPRAGFEAHTIPDTSVGDDGPGGAAKAPPARTAVTPPPSAVRSGDAAGAYVPAATQGDALMYVRAMGAQGAMMLAMIDRLQGIDQDLESQIADITTRNSLKKLYNSKLAQLNTMLQLAQDALGKKKETDTLTFTVPGDVATTGVYHTAVDDAGRPRIEELPADGKTALKLTGPAGGEVTVEASVADIKAAIDRTRSAMDSLTTDGEIAMVRLQYLENTKNNAVSMLSQYLRTSHDTLAAVIKNL